MGDDRSLRARPGDEGSEFGEGVPVGGDLGERSQGETGGPFDHCPGGQVGRSLQGESITNVLIDPPQLTSPGHGFGQQGPEIDQSLPVLGGAVAVDDPEQFVGVGTFDRLVRALVDSLRRRHQRSLKRRATTLRRRVATTLITIEDVIGK